MKSAKLVVHRIKAQINIVGTEMGGTGSEQSTCTVAEQDLRAMHQYHADNHNLATQAVRSACHHNTPRQLRRFGMKHQESLHRQVTSTCGPTLNESARKTVNIVVSNN